MNEPDRGVRGLLEFTLAFLCVFAGAAWASANMDQAGLGLVAGVAGALVVVVVNRSIIRR